MAQRNWKKCTNCGRKLSKRNSDDMCIPCDKKR